MGGCLPIKNLKLAWEIKANIFNLISDKSIVNSDKYRNFAHENKIN